MKWQNMKNYNLKLTAREAVLLHELLDGRIEELFEEIMHNFDLDFAVMSEVQLESSYDTLKEYQEILRKLQTMF